jgi:hypothetical protein
MRHANWLLAGFLVLCARDLVNAAVRVWQSE